MPSFEGNLLTQGHQITSLETRHPRLSYGENPESLPSALASASSKNMHNTTYCISIKYVNLQWIDLDVTMAHKQLMLLFMLRQSLTSVHMHNAANN